MFHFRNPRMAADATLYLRMMAFCQGILRGCRVHDPSGERVGCCCYHEGCCGDPAELEESCLCPAHAFVDRECTCDCDHKRN